MYSESLAQNTQTEEGSSWKRFLHPTKLIKEKLLVKFKDQILSWGEDERITDDEASQILGALDDPQVQIYLNLLVQQNFLTTFVIRTDVCTALGLYLTGSVAGAGIVEVIRMAFRNLHIQIAGTGLPFKERQKAALGGMTFGIGGQIPWIMLYKYLKNEYPDLYKYFKVYLSGRKFYNIVYNQRQSGPKPFTRKEAAYLNRLTTDEAITPENIIEIERQIFHDLLEGKSIKKPNIPSVNHANNTFEHAKTYGGIC